MIEDLVLGGVFSVGRSFSDLLYVSLSSLLLLSLSRSPTCSFQLFILVLRCSSYCLPRSISLLTFFPCSRFSLGRSVGHWTILYMS